MPRARGRDALLHQHLENVSSRFLEKHKDLVRNIIGRNAGIYALYKNKRLYYVGLASSLSHRLKQHLRDKHKRKWDRFSIFLTIHRQQIRDLESLLLRIAKPPGNSVSGRPSGSRNLLAALKREIRLKHRRETHSLFATKSAPEKVRAALSREAVKLTRLFPRGIRVEANFKGKRFRARVRRDGKIRFNGTIFTSLGLAATKAAGKRKNGWHFWSAERGKGNWVRLFEIRKAGTPLIPDR